MIGAYKPFDEELSNQFDKPGREVMKDFLAREWGVSAEDYDMYKVDLICKKNGVPAIFVEIEVRPPFTDKFPYETVHVPSRKKKLFANDLPTIYFVLNNNFTKALWINTDKITDYPLVEVKNKLIPNGEMFYDVPKDLFKEAYVGA